MKIRGVSSVFSVTVSLGLGMREVRTFWTVFSVVTSLSGVFSLQSTAYTDRGYEKTTSVQLTDEKRLIKHLLHNYERVGVLGRPVYNTTDTITVNYGLALIQILDLDEKNQVLTTNVWSRYSWIDMLLKWDPKEYGGLESIRIPSHFIWTPDIVLYNYADIRLREQREALVVVQHTGEILWIPMSIFRSTCSINILYFPYDVQECKLKFGSWTYDGFKLDLEFYADKDEVDTADYVASNEWRLLESPAKKNVIYYPCCDEPYPDLTFTVKLKRMAISYSFLLILPCVLLSFLTLVIFWLPPESPAKMLLGMNIFVAFFLLLRILADSTPPASASIPLIGIYFCLNMVLITLSSFLSVIVINLYHRTDKRNKLPDWLRKFVVHGISKFFGLQYEQLQVNRSRVQEHVTHVIESPARGRKNSREKKKIKSPVLQYNKWEPPPFGFTDSPLAARYNNTPELPTPIINQLFETDVKEIKRVMRNFMNKLRDRDAQYRVNLEWRCVALVVDRVFFTFYLVTIFVSLATVFPWNELEGSF